MLIARGTSHIVSTAKTPSYEGHKILQVVPEGLDGHPVAGAAPVVAFDLVDAGIGDRVLICQEGRWAREAVGDMNAPVRSMIVAVIDRVEISPETPPPPTPSA